ncbi:MAG TPA: hypothetical protein VNG33_04930 [Polyangiaceae bacterium]|nr:hypothetical protein [Polyangiaceae bacterium]
MLALEPGMKHPQAFALLILASAAAFGIALWSGSLWAALGVLFGGFVLAFVVSMAWLWSPRSGINSKRKPSSDSLSGLR